MWIHLLFLVAQVAAASPPATVLGVVSEAGPGKLTLRTDAEALVSLETTEKTVVLRSKPGATSLDGAAPLPLEEVVSGDRVLARGVYSPDRTALVVARLVVMKQEDVQARLERERADWRRRGVSGVITGLDASAGEFGVRLRAAGEAAPAVLVVATAGRSIVYRRYAPHSARFSDAQPSRFEDLAVSDQVRMLGNRSDEGRTFVPEQIVSGAFRTLRGTVLTADPALGEIRVQVRNGEVRTVVVSVGPEVRPRRMPPHSGSGQRGETAGSHGGPAASQDRLGRSSVDDVTERWPEISFADIGSGEEVAVLASRTDDGGNVRAIKLVAGLPRPAMQEQGHGQETDGGDDGPDMLGSGDEQP